MVKLEKLKDNLVRNILKHIDNKIKQKLNIE